MKTIQQNKHVLQKGGPRLDAGQRSPPDAIKLNHIKRWNAPFPQHVDTVEKAVLPAASDVVKEKNESAVISGVGGFDRQQLQHVDTVEKVVLPAADDVDIGKAKAVLSGVGEFDRQQLQHVATVEKDVKPDVEVIRKEKSETEVRWVGCVRWMLCVRCARCVLS